MNTHFLVYAGKNVFDMLLRLVIGCMTPVPGSYFLTGNEHFFYFFKKYEMGNQTFVKKITLIRVGLKEKVENSTFGSGPPP